MFGRRKPQAAEPLALSPARRRRHGRRPIRSSLTGSQLRNPASQVETFKAWAAVTIQYLRQHFSELDDVNIGFMSLPPYELPEGTQSKEPMFWLVSRADRTIYLFRSPIQQFRGLHEPDEIHRRMFVEWCVYQAVCEYLDEDPWLLMPGQFDHY